MALGHFNNIVTNGLVFYYDMNNTAKSFKGKPTINHAYTQNARTDASYVSYVQTTSGTWPAKHPDAIRVYNFQGNEITGYVNTGVGDYTNTYHAIWTLDPILKKPVVTMRDVDGQWKAKSFGLGSGTTPNAMGVGYGDTYTISWLQWTDNIAKSVNAGLYGQNTSGANGFHDGLSNSFATSYNTKPYTWQRVYATFTVSAVRNLAAGWSCYMYGHYITRGTVKIADVQIEVGTVSGFLENGESTRSTTQTIVDLTGQNTITANSLTYASDGTFNFNGSSNFITFPENSMLNTQTPTVEVWVKTNATTQNGFFFEKGTVNSQYALFQEGANITWRHTTNVGSLTAPAASFINTTQYAQIVGTYAAGARRIYVNGVQVAADSLNYTLPTNANGCSIGAYGGANGAKAYYYNGNIDSVKVYNRALTAAEIQQNFNALRGRYGI